MLQKLEFNLSKDVQEPPGVSTTSTRRALQLLLEEGMFFWQQPDEFQALMFFNQTRDGPDLVARRSFRRPDARPMGLIALQKRENKHFPGVTPPDPKCSTSRPSVSKNLPFLVEIRNAYSESKYFCWEIWD